MEVNNCGVIDSRVTTVTVGDVFHKKGAFTGGDPLFGELDALVDSDDIHSIDLAKLVISPRTREEMVGDQSHLDTGDSIASSVVGGVGRRSLGRGTHTVLIVLAYEDAGQVPEFSHVERFEHLTLVAGTVTVKSKSGNVVFAGILLSKGKTGSKRDLGADYPVSTKEGRGEDVHRSALSVGHAVLATEKLSQDTLNGASP